MIIFDHMLIGNAIDSGGVTLPLELADGIELTLADADQATAIRESLRYFERRMTGSTQHPEATVLDRRVHARDHDDPLDWRDIFDPTLNAPDGSSGGKIEYGQDGAPHYVVQHDLRPERPYHLVRFVTDNDHPTIMSVLIALTLGEHPLLCPISLTGPEPIRDGINAHHLGWITQPLTDVNDELRKAWSTQALAQPLVVDHDWARSVRQLIAKVRPIVDGEWPTIQEAFQRRLELQSVPLASPLRHLGYFVVVEALLTHAPAQGDPADSLGRQLQMTIPLLSNRMEIALPFADLDPHTSPSKLLSALYRYRSAIAHGAEPTFDGKQSVLGSREKVGAFLDVMTRRLLRHAALEPLLVTDLKGPTR